MRMPSLRRDWPFPSPSRCCRSRCTRRRPRHRRNRCPALPCEVWARELSFAHSVADRDAAAFAAHLQPQAVFGPSRPAPTRGRDAIVREWSGLIAGEPVQLQWYPTRVAIAGEPDIAYSSGPALYRGKDAAGAPIVSLGAFGSVWKRGDDGVWRVLFDDGIRPVPATEEQAAAFLAAPRSDCPRG